MLNNYGTDSFITTVNNRVITDWGNTDPPYTDAPIDPKSALRRGLGGNATRFDRINPGRTATLNLNPGGGDSAYMQSLINAGATITLSRVQVGSLETAIGTEGVIVNDGPVGRGGAAITDDQYIIELNGWTQTKGGE
jgi:hypothetical protein